MSDLMTFSFPVGPYTATIDDADRHLVEGRRWHPARRSNTIYVEHTLPSRTNVLLHRLIMDAPLGMEVDHRDHDGLNNTRANLRLATTGQNHANRRKRSDGRTSRFVGVCWNIRAKKWQAGIGVGGKKLHLGLFVDELEAAAAYDVAAFEAWGEFARPNLEVRS